MNGFPETYSVDPESTGQRPHDQIDNLIDEHEGSSLFNLLSFLTELAPGYSPLERMGEKETLLQKAGEIPTFLMGLGLLASPQGVRKTATKLGSRRVLKELGEEVVDPLYHNTPLTSVLDILKEGNLKGRSSISFSRDPSLRRVSGKYLREAPAQIVVSKAEIKNLGKINPKRFGGEARHWEGARAEELKGTIPSFKHEAEEVFFIPQQRHSAVKGVERARTPKRVANIPTEKFEAINIDKFMFDDIGYNFPRSKGGVSIPPDAIATSIRRESFKPGGNPDKPVIEYISELMREAHKRKVPIILGPEATETFYKLGMDKKLPKSWQGRLVTDKVATESIEVTTKFSKGLESEIDYYTDAISERWTVHSEKPYSKKEILQELMQDHMDNPQHPISKYKSELQDFGAKIGIWKPVSKTQLKDMVVPGKKYDFKRGDKYYIFNSWDPLISTAGF